MPARGTDLTWIDLTDFTPGIQSGWHTLGEGESAKDGAAQIDGTYGCVATPSGGLEPAPALVNVYALNETEPLDESWWDPAGKAIPATMRIHHMVVQQLWHGDVIDGNYVDGDAPHQALEPDTIMVATEYFTNGAYGPSGADALARQPRWKLFNQMDQLATPGVFDIGHGSSGGPFYTDQVSPQFLWGHIAMLYSSYSASPNPLFPGSPFAAWLYALQRWNTVPGTPQVLDATIETPTQFFPSVSNATQPNEFEEKEVPISGFGDYTDYNMCSHNDRLINSSVRIPTSGYSVSYTKWGRGDVPADDTLFFRGINNLQDSPPTNLVQLTSDSVDGIGAILSGPGNQLFIIRNHDGGLLVTGSMENPTITRFPGVEPTGGYSNHPVNTPLGVVYGTASGVFVWPGGDHATQLGKGLEGTFWLTEMQWRPGDPVISLHDRARRRPATPCGTFAYRAPFIYCPNNYIFDTRTGGWFRLFRPEETRDDISEPAHGFTMGHFAVGYGGKVYGSPTEIRRGIATTDTQNLHIFVGKFDPTEPSIHWKWTSQPLVRGRNRVLQVREFDMVGSGVGTIDVTITGIDDTIQTKTITFDGDRQMQRVTFHVDCYDPQITFEANGTNMRLHRASVGFHETTSTNVT